MILEFGKSVHARGGRFYYVDFQRVPADKESCLSLAASHIGLDTSSVSMDEIVATLQSLGSQSVVVFDEIEVFLQFSGPTMFIYYLRQFSLPWRRDNDPMIILVARSDWRSSEWNVMPDSALLDRMLDFPVGALTAEDSRALLIRRAGVDEVDDAIFLDELLILAGGHPYLNEHIGRALRHRAPHDDLPEAIFLQCAAYFQHIWTDIRPSERLDIARVVMGQISHARLFVDIDGDIDLATPVLGSLVAQGVVTPTRDRVFSPLFAWWVAKNASDLVKNTVDTSGRFSVSAVKSIFDTLGSAAKSIQSLSRLLHALGVSL